MKRISYLNLSLDKYIIHILNLMSLLFIFRSSLPAFKYPFILLYIVVFVNFIFSRRFKFNDIKQFLKSTVVIIALLLIFSVALFSTYKLYLEIAKELLSTCFLLSIAYFYSVIINSERQLKIALDNLVDWVIIISTFIAVVWIVDFIRVYLPNTTGVRLFNNQIIDYNFAIIPALFGIVSVLLKLSGSISKQKQYQLNFFLLLLYMQLFLTSSRRGFIIATAIIVLIFILYLVSFFVSKEWIINITRRVRPFIILFIAIFLSGYLFVKKTTFEFKTSFFKKIGIENGVGLTNEITEKYLKYINVFDPEKTISELYEEVWSPNLDPKDPDSGWGRKIHKTIFPLSGKNVSIIPEGVKGYYMDKTCNAYVFGGNAYSHTNIDMETHIVQENDTIKSSIFCFVSEDYDGDWVFLILSDNSDAWIGYAYYDLKNKGTWQELYIVMPVPSGRVTNHIYFAKLGASSFINLKGHVIFAYPQFTNLSETKRASIDGTEHTPGPVESSTVKDDEALTRVYDYQTISFIPGLVSSYEIISRLPAGDPIRNLAIRLFPIDTVYYSYKSNLQVDAFSNKFGEDRILRWKFAWQIFKLEYNWTQRFFGGGFSFLNWYGFYFLHDKTQIDWPHNPFLSILLYSGIFGLLLYCFFLYKVFYYYIKYLKEYPLLFIFFLIAFFFSFFSGGSPFDPPIIGFFSILPFLIHSIHSKSETEKTLSNAVLDE